MNVGDWVEFKYYHFLLGYTARGYITEINATQLYMQPVEMVMTRTGIVNLEPAEPMRLMRYEVKPLETELHPSDRAEIFNLFINLSLDSKDPGWFKELLEG